MTHVFTEQNEQDLRKLIDILREVEISQKPFDMRRFVIPSGCGTAACAAGYAAFDPEFQKRGFILKFKQEYYLTRPNRLVNPIYHKIKTPEDFPELCKKFHNESNAYPYYRGSVGYDACTKFFGLAISATLYLFSTNFYPNNFIKPSQVIERIEKVIASKGDRP
jgi:hypothetical protein